jgi:hypothetical protein
MIALPRMEAVMAGMIARRREAGKYMMGGGCPC